MSQVTIYTTRHCPYCVSAKRLLSSKGVAPLEIDVEQSPEALAEMMQRSGRRTVPQIFVGDNPLPEMATTESERYETGLQRALRVDLGQPQSNQA
ncbi:hypothetical protein LE197_06200 [Pseudomonas sp. PS1(2021)]|nr:glutaredoxin domain-containing protein [Pseudomonas sp. PS1(2021)]UCM31841.1 hypothetical protein LE197_06200 [Pseudomonas sp. PS1(2021)]